MEPPEILAIAAEEQQRANSILAGLGDCPIVLSKATTVLGTFSVDVRTQVQQIRLSRYLRDEVQVRDTVRHEIAHQVAYERHAYLGHGQLWKMWAEYLGCIPVACSSVGVDPEAIAQRLRYVLKCRLCGWTIVRQRKSKLIRNRRRYACAMCRGPLDLQEPRS